MPVSPLWAQIDPSASLRVVTDAPATTAETTPSTMASSSPFYSPSHPMFGFGVLTALTIGLVFYATEKGAGGGVKAHVGKLNADAAADLKGDKK